LIWTWGHRTTSPTPGAMKFLTISNRERTPEIVKWERNWHL
jgi:hypothetical protein